MKGLKGVGFSMTSGLRGSLRLANVSQVGPSLSACSVARASSCRISTIGTVDTSLTKREGKSTTIQLTNLACSSSTSQAASQPTYPPTDQAAKRTLIQIAEQPANSNPTKQPNNLPTLPACLPTYLPSYLPTYLPTYRPTDPPTCLPACLPAYLATLCLHSHRIHFGSSRHYTSRSGFVHLL